MECVRNHRIECPGHDSVECCLEHESWDSCNLCCGGGGWEEARPFHNDPYYAVSIKCPSCGGTGWECK